MHDIVVSAGQDGYYTYYTVTCGDLIAMNLTWDEALGCVAACLVPPRSKEHIAFLRTPMQTLLENIACHSLNWVFGGKR